MLIKLIHTEVLLKRSHVLFGNQKFPAVVEILVVRVDIVELDRLTADLSKDSVVERTI